VRTHPLLQHLGIEGFYVDEENPVTHAPDSVCLILRDGSALVLNQVENGGTYAGTEITLWKDGGVVSVVHPVKGIEA
jgi:hypothetical protein